MINLLKIFATDESAAITVDFVVLTAAIAGLGFAVITAMQPGIAAQSDHIATVLEGELND